jgi:signal transduction histidine kinase
MIFLTGHACL